MVGNASVWSCSLLEDRRVISYQSIKQYGRRLWNILLFLIGAFFSNDGGAVALKTTASWNTGCVIRMEPCFMMISDFFSNYGPNANPWVRLWLVHIFLRQSSRPRKGNLGRPTRQRRRPRWHSVAWCAACDRPSCSGRFPWNSYGSRSTVNFIMILLIVSIWAIHSRWSFLSLSRSHFESYWGAIYLSNSSETETSWTDPMITPKIPSSEIVSSIKGLQPGRMSQLRKSGGRINSIRM